MGKQIVVVLMATAMIGFSLAGCSDSGVDDAPTMTTAPTISSTPVLSLTPDPIVEASASAATQSQIAAASSAASAESVRLVAEQEAARLAAEQAAVAQAAADQAAAEQAAAAQAAVDQAAAEQAAADQSAEEQAAADEEAARSDGWYDDRGWVSPETAARALAAGIGPGEQVPGYLRCGTICGESPTSGEIQAQHEAERVAEQEALQSRVMEAEGCLFLVDGECSGGPEGS